MRAGNAAAVVLMWAAVFPFAQPAAAWCRASVETSPLSECEEVPGVALLRWTRGCVRYAFQRDFFRRLPQLSEQEIRADFEAAFAAYREVDCGRDAFAVLQSAEVAGADRAEFNWDVENESLMSVRTGREWEQLEYDANAIALTLLFFDPDNGEIYDVDLEINAGIGALIHCEGACTAGEVDLPSTLVHEAGHYLGLGHSDIAGSTMASHADVGTLDKRTLEDDDRDGYCALELPEPGPDLGGDEARCEVPVFPQFVKVESPASDNGCAVSALRARDRSRSLALCMLAALAAALRLRSALRRAQRAASSSQRS